VTAEGGKQVLGGERRTLLGYACATGKGVGGGRSHMSEESAWFLTCCILGYSFHVTCAFFA
jgi:hypothetical protein